MIGTATSAFATFTVETVTAIGAASFAWSRAFTTAVTYGEVNVSNLDIQLGDALHRTQRGSLNLTWNPIPQADIVVEFLGGRRINKDGQRGLSSQVQAGWTLKF